MKTKLAMSAIAAIVLMSCGASKQFRSQEVETVKVKRIAVLPVRVSFTGNLPKNITQPMIDSMVVQQGSVFQHALAANLLRYNGNKNKIQGADIQSVDKTNGLLQKNHLTPASASNMDPDELAKLLEVDAVVRMNVTSNRIMSELASLGLGTLRNILFWGTNADPFISGSISNQTAKVYADCALLKDGRTLWAAQYDEATDWNTSTNDVIAKITKKMGKGFPY
jgi:hypothetical protein